jgi:hypothetical protein
LLKVTLMWKIRRLTYRRLVRFFLAIFIILLSIVIEMIAIIVVSPDSYTRMLLQTAWDKTHFGQYIILNLLELLREIGSGCVE